MANKRHKPEEIVQKLRQVDVLVGQGVQRVDAIREVRIFTACVRFQTRNHGSGQMRSPNPNGRKEF